MAFIFAILLNKVLNYSSLTQANVCVSDITEEQRIFSDNLVTLPETLGEMQIALVYGIFTLKQHHHYKPFSFSGAFDITYTKSPDK